MIPPKAPQPPLVPTPITLSKVLLTEGVTPTHFCEALLQHLKLDDLIEVRNFGGIGDVRAVLAATAMTTEFKRLVKSLGIIRDAEGDARKAQNEVQTAIRAANLVLCHTMFLG
jgi:hypothetical protein